MMQVCFWIAVFVGILFVVVPLMVIAVMMAMQPRTRTGPTDHQRAPCVSCKKQISIEDTKCPHCGAINKT